MIFVSLNTALKLKELCFNDYCDNAYATIDNINYNRILDYCTYKTEKNKLIYTYHNTSISNDESLIPCPTIGQTIEWLDKNNYFISIEPFPTMSTINKISWYYKIKYNSNGMNMDSFDSLLSYQNRIDALNAAIEYTIFNLFDNEVKY